MKLSIKLMAALFLVILGLLAADTFLLVRRDIDDLDADMRRDALHIGRVLQGVLSDAWRNRGEDAARDLVGRLNREDDTMTIRLAGPGDLPAGMAPADSVAVFAGGEISFRSAARRGAGFRHTLVPLDVDAAGPRFVVVSESLADENAVARRAVLRAFVLGGLMLAAGAGLLVPVSLRMVGRPLRRLVAKTERIGAGDLGGDLVLSGHDELSELARAMNRMCAHLAEARDLVRTETDAKLDALEQLRHAERLAMLGRIASGLAHELGTPLNVVAGRAKMIGGGRLAPDDVTASARIIGEQADRMTGIIRQLLDYARRGVARRTPERVTGVAARTLEMLGPVAAKHGVRLELVVAPDLPAAVVDRAQMEQVLMNLVMNGIQAMPRGGELRVELGVRRGDGPEADRLVVRVVDAGEGIPAGQLGQVLEPFFTTKQTGQGTGLGLPIVKGIVEDNGGTLELASEVGRGTTVTVELPLKEEA